MRPKTNKGIIEREIMYGKKHNICDERCVCIRSRSYDGGKKNIRGLFCALYPCTPKIVYFMLCTDIFINRREKEWDIRRENVKYATHNIDCQSYFSSHSKWADNSSRIATRFCARKHIQRNFTSRIPVMTVLIKTFADYLRSK